ncbi:hypothetical protein [Glaciibacter sp. 2TAF33]|uniref:hypothetical protein n=1 Tax=Glaciibacter sp. 2TAF33 TaxID=3233015 RepID=UPI003F9281E6
MPSFRVTMTLGALRSGVAPEAVVPHAASAAAELTTVEASDLAVVAGHARVTVRFTADDPELALQIADHVVAATDAVARPLDHAVTERVKGRWFRVG